MEETFSETSLFDELRDNLSEINSFRPFDLVFYGSRARGDHTPISDYNFYLIASVQDQMNGTFIQSIGKALNLLESESSVSLVAGDRDSFRMRVELFEPTSIHLCELGQVLYGQNDFVKLQEEWQTIKHRKPDIPALLSFLDNRYNFYKTLKPRNTKEDVSRLEKILQLNLQIWILNHIPDLTVTEIWFMDIPSRLILLLQKMYGSEINEEVKLLITLYEEIHELKQNIRMIFPYSDNQMNRIKESIQQIRGLSKILEKKS